VAREIVDAMKQLGDRAFLLGCPTGRTPGPVYECLADEMAADSVDPTRLVFVLMDEYLTHDLELVNPQLSFSCVGYANRCMVGPIKRVTGREPAIWCPQPNDPAEYDRRIAAAGGIDLFLLASGASDGHIGFNPPGSSVTSITRIIELSQATRQDNLATWPALETIDQVPTHGVSVGISTIVDQSRRAIMMLLGTDKRQAFNRIVSASNYEPDWPATAVASVETHTIIADRQAAGA